jgi:hypothetical protein
MSELVQACGAEAGEEAREPGQRPVRRGSARTHDLAVLRETIDRLPRVALSKPEFDTSSST